MSTAVAIPAIHSVHFYESDAALIDRLCGVVCSGLLLGNSVVMVATASHRELLVRNLNGLEVDIRKYARERRFAMYDAEETLAQFMVNGMPDETRFNKTVGTLLNEARNAARSADHGITVFGEMVAILWKQNNSPAAIALEKIWNNALAHQPFHLHCAYPTSLFADSTEGMEAICDTHSHVLGASFAKA